jgi:hypothetical protein
MNIGKAVEALKAGKRVARAGWNGNGMWLPYVSGRPVDRSLPCVKMKTAQGDLVPWRCSQTDLLADDWEVLP